MREQHPDSYFNDIENVVKQYRNDEITIDIRTKTKNDDKGAAKSVNSFPYVQGNFCKAGVFYKGDSGRYFISDDRIEEVDNAIKEVGLCRNLAK